MTSEIPALKETGNIPRPLQPTLALRAISTDDDALGDTIGSTAD